MPARPCRRAPVPRDDTANDALACPLKLRAYFDWYQARTRNDPLWGRTNRARIRRRPTRSDHPHPS
jgi:hypothetical protein